MEALGIDSKLLIAQVINFGIFFYVFKRFIYKPFTEYFAQQMKNEKDKDRLLTDLQKKEEQLNTKAEKVLKDAKESAQEVLKEAKAMAESKKQEMIEDTKKEIAEMKKKFEADMENERAKLYEEVKTRVIEVSSAMTENILKEFVDAKSQKQMLDSALKKLKSSKVYEN